MVCIVKGMVFPIVVYICESWTFIFGGSKITADGDCSHEIKTLDPWKKSYDQPRQHIKNQRHYFGNKNPSSQRFLQWSCMDVRVGPYSKLNSEELKLLKDGVGEDS